jgi:uncharacterized protein (TIGR03492 family)
MLVRIISNGFGEDLIASKLIQAMDNQNTLSIFPLVGTGQRYLDMGLRPMIRQRMLPSGGFLMTIPDMIRDVSSGLIGQCWHQYQTLKNHAADYQIVVGDIFALFMATRHSKIPTFFLPTAKSERAIPHMGIEHWLMRAHATRVFPRDQETHHVLVKKGISSCFLGNPMFDGLTGTTPPPITPTIGVLPGSRHEGLKNIPQLLRIIHKLHPHETYRFIMAIPPHFQSNELKDAIKSLPWELQSTTDGHQYYHPQTQRTVHVSYDFLNALHQSFIVIGLAGTANEQALFAKRPVISFIGAGPQSSKKRFLQQQQLIEGAKSHFINASCPSQISQDIDRILNQTPHHWTPLSDYHQTAAQQMMHHINDYLQRHI